jgi:hypothetical protein
VMMMVSFSLGRRRGGTDDSSEYLITTYTSYYLDIWT